MNYFYLSNLTKAIEHVQRLATMLHILKVVSRRNFNLVDHVGTFESLDENFRKLVETDELSEADLIIDFETCFNAKKLMDHFLWVKMVRSNSKKGY